MLKKLQNAKNKTVAFVKKNKTEIAYIAGFAVGTTTQIVMVTRHNNRDWNRAHERLNIGEGDILMRECNGSFYKFTPHENGEAELTPED